MITAKLNYARGTCGYCHLNFSGPGEQHLQDGWYQRTKAKFKKHQAEITKLEQAVAACEKQKMELKAQLKASKKWYRPWYTQNEQKLIQQIKCLTETIEYKRLEINGLADNAFFTPFELKMMAEKYLSGLGFVRTQSSVGGRYGNIEIDTWTRY